MDYVHTWKHIQEVYCQRGRENESLKKRIDQLVMDAWKQNGDWMWLINIYLFFLLNFFAACMLFAMQRPKSLCWDQKALGVSNEDWRPTSCPNPPNPWHEVFGLPGRNCHQWRSAAHEEKALKDKWLISVALDNHCIPPERPEAKTTKRQRELRNSKWLTYANISLKPTTQLQWRKGHVPNTPKDTADIQQDSIFLYRNRWPREQKAKRAEAKETQRKHRETDLFFFFLFFDLKCYSDN
jgi:hypothetical protein